METIKVRIKGESPILMHNGRLANPLDEFTKELSRATKEATKAKTDEAHIAKYKAEFAGSLYLDENGPYVPADNLESALKGAAKFQKLGKKFGASVAVLEEKAPLQYKGPRDVDGLWSKGFFDIRSVKVQASRVQRCRAIFTDWACEFTVAFDQHHVDRRQVEQALLAAGREVGLFDRRPEKGGRYGKFAVEVLQ